MQTTKSGNPMETAGAQGYQRDSDGAGDLQQTGSKHLGAQVPRSDIDYPADRPFKPVRKPTVGLRPPSARSRIANGKDVLPGIDNRSLVARRYRDIMSAIVLDQGGLDMCSATLLELIRRFSATAVLAERLEAKLACGEVINSAEHALLSSTLCRLAHRIGIKRIPRDVGGVTLGDLLRANPP
jgi:hypothetical protein